MALTPAMEDYLEAILMIKQQHGYVRCVDVAEQLGVKKPSVSRAVKELSKSGHLVKNADGTLSLTELGLQIAEQIYEKHLFFTKQLILAGVDPETAEQDACGIEHAVSSESFQKLKKAFDDGKLTYVGDYKAPDYETIIAGAPTLAIYSTMLTGKPDVAEKLKELGINYILDQSTYEENPLGRVEWAKFYAALCNEEDAATTMYNTQAAYVDTLSKAEKTGKSVAVFYITSKGKLYVRNAGDYLTQMVNMAGGEYIFSDLNTDKTGTQEMNIESFYEKAKDADYVIYIWSLGGKPSTLSDFTGYNSVLSDMKAVKDGNVWCTTPDFFQIADTIGSMINDINLMLNADSNTTELTYLKKLQ